MQLFWQTAMLRKDTVQFLFLFLFWECYPTNYRKLSSINNVRCTEETALAKFVRLGNEPDCASQCDANSECAFFIIWTHTNQGNCELCSEFPTHPTGVSKGYRTDIYEKGCSNFINLFFIFHRTRQARISLIMHLIFSFSFFL